MNENNRQTTRELAEALFVSHVAVEHYLKQLRFTKKLTRSKIHDLGWEILPHPPYSPDLASSDYYLFLTLNNAIGGQQFDGALKTSLTNFFASKHKVFYERGIRKLPVK